jgi:hypothetical protein
MSKQEIMQACFDLLFMEEVQYCEWALQNPDGDHQIYHRNINALSKCVRREMREYAKTRHCTSLRCKDEKC